MRWRHSFAGPKGEYSDCRSYYTADDWLCDDMTVTRLPEPMVAAWTIIQDVGMGFFGTEVPTTTITKRGVAASEDPNAPDTGYVPAMDRGNSLL